MVLALVVLPLNLAKELKEMKIVSYLLFTMLISFLVILTIEIIQEGAKPISNLMKPGNFKDSVNSLFSLIVAYTMQFSLFPTQCSLIDKSKHNTQKATNAGVRFSTLVYVSTGLLAVFLFGDDTKISILQNFSVSKGFLNNFLASLFCVVLACHIPFVFYPCKESMLLMIDEVRCKSMSK